MRTRVGLFLLLAIAACGKADEGGVDEKGTMGLAALLAAVSGAEPTQSASLLAQGAFESVAPSMMCLKGFAAAATERARMEALFDCGLACTPDAVQKLKGTEPRTWMAGLAAACKADHFALDADQIAMLSPEWFVLQKIGEIAARHAKAATGASKAKLGQAMAGFRMPLPLPAVAAGRYDLPVVPDAASIPIATRTYVIASGDGMLWVGATPHGVLGGAGAGIAAAKGFPGNEADRAGLRAAVYQAAGAEEEKPAAAPPPDAAPPAPDAGAAKGQYKMKSNKVDPKLAREKALEQARSAGILKELDRVNGRIGSLDGTFGGVIAGLRGPVEHNLRGDHMLEAEPVPLLIADRARPAAEVIEIGVELKKVFVAVASTDDPAARALPIELAGDATGDGLSPAGAIRITIDSAGAEVEAYPIAGEATMVPRQASAIPEEGLSAAMAAVRQKLGGGQVDEVVVKVRDGVPWSDAVSVAAMVIARGGKQVVLTTEKLDVARGSFRPAATERGR
jgi:hypothetical protein